MNRRRLLEAALAFVFLRREATRGPVARRPVCRISIVDITPNPDFIAAVAVAHPGSETPALAVTFRNLEFKGFEIA